MKNLSNQSRAPIYEALQKFREMRVVPFDVPGHKHGRGNPELTEFLGQQCVGIDVNRYPISGNSCRRGLWRSPCLFNGRRHNKLRTEHGFILL